MDAEALFEDAEDAAGVGADDRFAGGVGQAGDAVAGQVGGFDGAFDGLPVEQAALDVVDGDRAGVVVGLAALVAGAVVPGGATLAVEPIRVFWLSQVRLSADRFGPSFGVRA
ncbi:hypothetical protein [Nonomuraea sp. GTA35]|uniref:hypothetical protein n=1 Tax=Nonomuraea sp. GTA35 TaxID=1676746 RepID=UPI0035BEE602